ncbi:hypothetical protein [Streptomyces sp. NPDC048057]|uniref:hypothetical protein n=1 Tax=Streptomyces sp. NPDC048057 TaxID=3155628 RepID=UPI003407BA51
MSFPAGVAGAGDEPVPLRRPPAEGVLAAPPRGGVAALRATGSVRRCTGLAVTKDRGPGRGRVSGGTADAADPEDACVGAESTFVVGAGSGAADAGAEADPCPDGAPTEVAGTCPFARARWTAGAGPGTSPAPAEEGVAVGPLGSAPTDGTAPVPPVVRTTLALPGAVCTVFAPAGAVRPTARAMGTPAAGVLPAGRAASALAAAVRATARTAPALLETAALPVVPEEREPLPADGDGTAVTTGPPCARAARWTAAVPCACDPGPLGGSARIRTAGGRCTGGACPANGRAPVRPSSPDTGPAVDERSPSPSTALDVPSRTACEAVVRNDGFCQVGSRPPNPASATAARPGPVTRWIGASPSHDAVTVPRPRAAESSAGAPAAPEPDASPLPGSGSLRRLRRMSRKPTDQSSAPARVTRAAISPA